MLCSVQWNIGENDTTCGSFICRKEPRARPVCGSGERVKMGAPLGPVGLAAGVAGGHPAEALPVDDTPY